MLYRWSSKWGEAMTIESIIPLLIMGGAFLLIAIVSHTTGQGNLDHIKSKTVGDGQHGTARWASKKEIQQTFKHIPFRPEVWRKGKDLPTDQGLVLGCVSGPSVGSLRTKIFKQKTNDSKHPAIQALVDTDDIHCLMIGASGIGKTAFFLYPNLEYACACGMSFLAAGYQGRSGAKLRNHRRSVLRLSGGGHRPAESHSIRRIQSADSHQSLHGYLPGEF